MPPPSAIAPRMLPVGALYNPYAIAPGSRAAAQMSHQAPVAPDWGSLVPDPAHRAGEQAYELTGSPLAAAAATTLGNPLGSARKWLDWGDKTAIGLGDQVLAATDSPALATGTYMMSDPANAALGGLKALPAVGGALASLGSLGWMMGRRVGRPDSALGRLNAFPRQLGALGTPKRMSRAESEAAGYWHPISDTRLERPFHEITSTRQPDPDIQVPPREYILPESLEGNILIPATGDRTAAGEYLTGINDVKFERPVKLSGGPDFMRTHGSSLDPDLSTVWAAAPSVTKQLYGKVRAAADKGVDAALMYMPMSFQSSDFSTMMSDSLLEQMKVGKITKKLKREFDKELREIRPEWKGIDHAESREQLDSNGELRKAFIQRMGLKKYHGGGFPELGSTRAGIMERGLLDAPLHAGGYSIGRLDPDRVPTLSHPMPHASYPSQVHGSYLGGFEVPVPRDILFSDFAKNRRLEGGVLSRDARAFQLSHPSQKVDAEWVDNVSRYIEANR